MSLRKRFETDTSAENKGARYEAGTNEDGTKIVFFVARMSKSNTQYQRAVSAAVTTTIGPGGKLKVSEEEAERIMLEVFATTIVTGWENVTAEDVGLPVEIRPGVEGRGIEIDKLAEKASYSRENSIALFKALPDLRAEIEAFAAERTNYLASYRENAAKN